MRLNRKQLIIAAVVAGAGLFLLLLPLLMQGNREKKPSCCPDDFQIALQRAIDAGMPLFLSPELLGNLPENSFSLSPSKAEAEKASRDPSFFHALNREKRFSAVLLSRTGGSAPLGESLLTSPRWILTDITPWGYRFEPVSVQSPAAWNIPTQESLLDLHPQSEERTLWLLGTAENLIVIGRTREAEQLLTMAAATQKFPSRVLGVQASLAASRGQWNEALAFGKAAVSKNSENDAARAILIRALTESGRPDEALDEARNLVRRQKNTETLFLLARAANAANSGNEEIVALQGVVELGRKNHQPLGATLTYLGQAMARNGQRGSALRAFREALASPELSEEQRRMIRQLADHITPDQTSN